MKLTKQRHLLPERRVSGKDLVDRLLEGDELEVVSVNPGEDDLEPDSGDSVEEPSADPKDGEESPGAESDMIEVSFKISRSASEPVKNLLLALQAIGKLSDSTSWEIGDEEFHLDGANDKISDITFDGELINDTFFPPEEGSAGASSPPGDEDDAGLETSEPEPEGVKDEEDSEKVS